MLWSPNYTNCLEKLLIVDGQQRLTTCMILLCALRDVAVHYKDEKTINTIENLIYNNRKKALKYRENLPNFNHVSGKTYQYFTKVLY